MLRANQFRYADDNLGYVIHGEEEAMVVDGGAVAAIVSHLEGMKLALRYVASTHNHPDHTSGNADLMNRYGAMLLNPGALPDGFRIRLDGHEIVVFRTPGHTDDSVCFYAGPFLFTGDTLFAPGYGRTDLPGGSWSDLVRSLRRLQRSKVRIGQAQQPGRRKGPQGLPPSCRRIQL